MFVEFCTVDLLLQSYLYNLHGKHSSCELGYIYLNCWLGIFALLLGKPCCLLVT